MNEHSYSVHVEHLKAKGVFRAYAAEQVDGGIGDSTIMRGKTEGAAVAAAIDTLKARRVARQLKAQA